MTRVKRRRRVAFALVAALASAAALIAFATEALNRTELDTVDARFSVRGPQEQPGDLVVVGVDDVTFGALQQRWPLPRSLHGDLIRQLTRAGVRGIVYDVQFTEPTTPREDNVLINAVADADVPVVLATEEVDDRGRSRIFGGEGVLRQIGARAGHSAFDPDPGGVLRRLSYETGGLKSLAVAAVEEDTGAPVDGSSFPPNGAWIDFYGPPETIPTYSFSRVLNGRVGPEALRGRIVVVGVTTPNLQDVHPVPTSANELMPGSEIQANAIATVQRGLPLTEASWPLGALLIFALATAVPAAGLRWRALPAAGLGVLAVGLYLVSVQLAFNSGLILPVVYPLLAAVVGLVGTLAVHYVLEAFERQRVHDTFARFVPADVVGEVLERTDQDLRLGGVRRECTVLFSDLRGFTTFAESREPDEVVAILNRYLGEMTDAIMDHGGTLISYMGDGIMAVFGAPLEQPDHADRALAAAREMLGPRLDGFNRWIDGRGVADGFQMGVGVNSGAAMTGQVGSARRVEYTAIGDTTNTAARLEAMTKGTPYSLFLSESTKELLSDAGDLQFVDRFEVRGRAETIGVWTVDGGPR